MAKNEFVFKVIADLSQPERALSQYTSKAKAAASKALAVPETGAKPSLPQRRAALAEAKGRAKAETKFGFEQGVFGDPSSAQARKTRDAVYAAQNREFKKAREAAGVGLTPKQEVAQRKAVEKAQEQHLDLLRRATTETQLQLLLDGKITDAKKLIEGAERRRAKKATQAAAAQPEPAAASSARPAKRKIPGNSPLSGSVDPIAAKQAGLVAEAEQIEAERAQAIRQAAQLRQRNNAGKLDDAGKADLALAEAKEQNLAEQLKFNAEAQAALQQEAAGDDASKKAAAKKAKADEASAKAAAKKAAAAKKGAATEEAAAKTKVPPGASPLSGSRPKKRNVPGASPLSGGTDDIAALEAEMLASANADVDAASAAAAETKVTKEEAKATKETTKAKAKTTESKKKLTKKQQQAAAAAEKAARDEAAFVAATGGSEKPLVVSSGKGVLPKDKPNPEVVAESARLAQINKERREKEEKEFRDRRIRERQERQASTDKYREERKKREAAAPKADFGGLSKDELLERARIIKETREAAEAESKSTKAKKKKSKSAETEASTAAGSTSASASAAQAGKTADATTVKAKKKVAQETQRQAEGASKLTAEQQKRIREGAQAGIGLRKPRQAEDPAAVARRQQAEQRAKIQAQDALLENPVKDLSQVSYKQGLEILAQQRAQIRAAGQKTAADVQAAQLAELAVVEAEFNDKEGIKAKARLVAAEKKLAAAINLSVEKILTADQEYLTVQRETIAVKQRALAAELRYQLANETFKQDAAINVQKSALSERRLNVERELLLADTATLEIKAKNIVLEEQYQRALAAEVRLQAEAAGLQQKGMFARLFGGGGSRGGGGGRYGIGQGPNGGQGGGLGGFFGQGAATTLKYAVPSAILFGAAAGITSSVKAATELEKTLNQIEAQFIATDKAAEFPGFRESILQIARDSGLAAEAVAEIGFQLQGAFGESDAIGGRTGTNLVQDQLEASAEISRVTGLTQKEIVDSLTAASFAFDASFRDIGDVTLQLQDRFGVLAKEIIPFLGDIAPVAQAAGFSLEEFATIAALTQQKSGRSGTALAEAYGRVLPALSEAKEELYQLAQTNDSLNNQEFLQAVATGDAAPIFLGLSKSFSSMTKSSQDFVIQLLGGRREASAILAAFEDGDLLMQEINATSRDNNVLAARYAKLQETLSQQVAKLAEEFRQFGIDLYEAGLGDALKTLVSSFSFLLDVLGGIVSLFSDFNGLLGGIPGKLLAILAVIKLIQVTMGSGFGQKIGGIPSTIRTAAQNGPSLSGLASGVGGFAGTVRSQGLTGPNRALGPQGAIGGSGVAQFAAVIGAAYAVSEVQKSRERVQGDLDSARQQIVEKLTTQSRGEVNRFIADRDSFMDQVRTDGWVATVTPWLTGASNLKTTGIDARQQQDAPRILAALRAFENLPTPGFEKDQALLEEVITNFSNDPTNDQFYEDARQYLITAAGVSREARNAINGRLGQSQAVSDAQEEADRAAASAVLGLGAAQQDLEGVLKDFEAGRGTSADVEQAYQNAIDVYTTATSGVGLAPDPTTIALLQDAILARDKFVAEQILGANELAQTLGEATGGGGPEAEIAGLQAALRNPKFTDAASRRQAALDIVALDQELLDTQVQAADNAGEALSILENGVAVDPETRITLILEQLRGNRAALGFIEGFNGAAKKTVGFLQESSDDIAALMVETGKSYNEAVLQLIDQAIHDKLVLLSYSSLTTDARAQILRALSSLYDQKDALKNVGPVDVNPVDRVTGSAADIADQQAQAWDDAAAYAQDQQDRLDEWRQAARDIEDAQADLFKAGIENDPVALARFEQSEADRALRNATSEAERLSAQAQRIRADRGLQEAIQDVFASQADLLNAMFEYGGNTVQAARLGLKTAKDRLAYLQASGAGDAAINRAKGDVISAQGGLRDARLDRKLQDYQFLYDMDKINKQQYIAYLMQLKEIPDLTTQQLRDLDRQIKSLRDELGADFQFNLPTTLGLPTLYEVRRTNQTPGGGGSYQDMRNYNIVLYVNNGMDQAAAEQFLSEAMGTNRVSTGTRRY